MYKKDKLCTYEVVMKQTPFFYTDENGERHFDSEDVVIQEVVRCKDCKYNFNCGTDSTIAQCERDALLRNPNFFCADGDRERSI